MAKRKEVILQEVLNTPQLWENAMAKEKLYVVDVHQKWCGPCKAITGMLKRIKNELGDEYLCFAVAEADGIPPLEPYRGKCEPVFLFFGCGQLIAYVRGCNAPLLQQTILDMVQHEHKVLEGQAERKVLKDTQEPEEAEEEKGEEESEEEGGEIVVRKQVTVALIKPDVVANGQVDEILEKITEAGMEVLVNEERQLTEEEAKSFYQNKTDEVYFDELITYVTSGPCRILVLTRPGSGEGIVEQWREIIGPFDAAVAKEDNPESLRAIYGTDAKANALHGSSSQEEAASELGFFFPDFEPPTYRASSAAPSARSRASSRSRKSAKKQKQLQRTLAIIRPDALQRHRDAIMEKIAEAGFQISMMKEMQLSEEQAKAFYKDHADQPYFEKLVGEMTSGPLLALCLAHTDAIQKWRDMLGPKVPTDAIEQQPESLRAQFHVEDAPVNMLHGSDSKEAATEELKSIFDIQQSLAVIKPDAIEQKDAIIEKLKEAGFMISCQKDMNLTREIASQIYKSKEGTEFYDSLIDHMTSGPTLMMVLSSEDAVSRLRTLMGPTDPDEAKQSAPDSLRALFAKSVLENAIHSPSNTEMAKEEIKIIFGDVEFNWDGTVRERGAIDDVTEEAEESHAMEEQVVEKETEKKEDEQKPEEGEAPATEGEEKPANDGEEKPVNEGEEKPVNEDQEKPVNEGGEKLVNEGEEEEKKEDTEPAAATEESADTPAELDEPPAEETPAVADADDSEEVGGQSELAKSEEGEGGTQGNESTLKTESPPKTREEENVSEHQVKNDQNDSEEKTILDSAVVQTPNSADVAKDNAPTLDGASDQASIAVSEKPNHQVPAESGSRPVSAKSRASSKSGSRPRSAKVDSAKPESKPPSRKSDRNSPKPHDGAVDSRLQ